MYIYTYTPCPFSLRLAAVKFTSAKQCLHSRCDADVRDSFIPGSRRKIWSEIEKRAAQQPRRGYFIAKQPQNRRWSCRFEVGWYKNLFLRRVHGIPVLCRIRRMRDVQQNRRIGVCVCSRDVDSTAEVKNELTYFSNFEVRISSWILRCDVCFNCTVFFV